MKGYGGLGRGRTPGRQCPHSTEVIVGTQGTEVTVVTASWVSRAPRESSGETWQRLRFHKKVLEMGFPCSAARDVGSARKTLWAKLGRQLAAGRKLS